MKEVLSHPTPPANEVVDRGLTYQHEQVSWMIWCLRKLENDIRGILEDAKDEEQIMDDVTWEFWWNQDNMTRHKFVIYLLELKVELERSREEENEKLCMGQF